MKYRHILLAFASEYWAMEECKLFAIIDLLAAQADGIKFDAAEIEARITPQTAAAVARREGSVAIVPLRGVISNRINLTPNSSTGGGTSAEAFANAIERAGADDTVKAVVVDADTPGGNVQGVEEAAAAIASLRGRKPVVVQVNGNLASAGYWIGSAADEIVATPSSALGAIGVRTAYDNIIGALEKQGVEREVFSAGKYKGEGVLGPLSDDARAHIQSTVDEYYTMFVDRVAQGRNVSSDTVRNGFGEGRMVSASQAVKLGMADRIGTMAETLARFTSTSSGSGSRARRERALALL
ncbi:S49 family peptidase [Sphingosinithalassobacter portus]|uniref:S49 family peptidase n=1 Tax=Stakelama portus TaxID=2676234 RepID=UPI000D6E3F90|nr:S49 family peptidase [Sphingosinithalassobacter portus]